MRESSLFVSKVKVHAFVFVWKRAVVAQILIQALGRQAGRQISEFGARLVLSKFRDSQDPVSINQKEEKMVK